MPIAVIGTLDTKGEEIQFLRDRIRMQDCETVVFDCGILGEPGFQAEVTREEIAREGGTELRQLQERRDRGEAMDVMGVGTGRKLLKYYKTGDLEGVVGAGGSGNTSIVTEAMRQLPVGVPKLMVSTLASGDVSNYVDIKDICMMFSVGDIEGLNRLTRTILNNAAGAIAGMEKVEKPAHEEKLTVAISMFGVTTPAAKAVRSRLEQMGAEVLVFHAVGSGGRAMESLVEQGVVQGLVDLTTTEIADELVGGILSAGPERLNVGVEKKIPQVIVPGALDMVNYGPRDSVPEEFEDRHFHIHNPQVTLMRTTPEENREFARFIARKLTGADPRRVTVMLPLKGVSMIDKEGEDFYDPNADRAFREALKRELPEEIPVREIDAHINDEIFTDAVVDQFTENARQAQLEF